MFKLDKKDSPSATHKLVEVGYWSAQASQYLHEKKYSKAVELCKENLIDNSAPLSARLIYARALYHAGQIDSAENQFYLILSLDPENLVALKYLGDIKFTLNDDFGAMTFYQKILSLDPHCTGLKSDIKTKKTETTKTITLKRTDESTEEKEAKGELRGIPFYTETIGDLYLAQGFPRLAEEVFSVLNRKNNNPRFVDKLAKAREKIKEKEHPHVKKTD